MKLKVGPDITERVASSLAKILVDVSVGYTSTSGAVAVVVVVPVVVVPIVVIPIVVPPSTLGHDTVDIAISSRCRKKGMEKSYDAPKSNEIAMMSFIFWHWLGNVLLDVFLGLLDKLDWCWSGDGC